MTQPLNYTSKAIADLAKLAESPTFQPEDRAGILFLQRKLQQAEVFVLPESGELIDRTKPRPQVPGTILRPPFPVVALEYASRKAGFSDPVFQVANSSRRISLAWEWDGNLPSGENCADSSPAGSGVVIASISFIDGANSWFPMMGAIMIPYDNVYRRQIGDPSPAQQAFLASGRITEKQLQAEKLEVGGVMTILCSAMALCAQKGGFHHAMDVLQADLMDEIGAYLDLTMTLACTNVAIERHAQPERLNRSRIRSGKPPLKDFHVLKITGQGAEAFGAHGSGGVRSHLRRGHIRRLGRERLTWVNACMVRGSKPGFVNKQYAVATGGAH